VLYYLAVILTFPCYHGVSAQFFEPVDDNVHGGICLFDTFPVAMVFLLPLLYLFPADGTRHSLQLDVFPVM
jgi:hypothetical protein